MLMFQQCNYCICCSTDHSRIKCRQLEPRICDSVHKKHHHHHHEDAENAGRENNGCENDGPSKLQGMKLTDQCAGHEIAGRPAISCPAHWSVNFMKLQDVLQFHALHIGPSISCPAISCPAILMVRHFHVLHFQSTRRSDGDRGGALRM